MATFDPPLLYSGDEIHSSYQEGLPRRSGRIPILTEKGESFAQATLDNDLKKLKKMLGLAEQLINQPRVDQAECKRLYQEINSLNSRLNHNVEMYKLTPVDDETLTRLRTVECRLIQSMQPSKARAESHRSAGGSSRLSQSSRINMEVLKLRRDLQRQSAIKERQLEEMNRRAKELERQREQIRRQREEMDRQSEEMERQALELKRQLADDKITAQIQIEERKAELYDQMAEDEEYENDEISSYSDYITVDRMSRQASQVESQRSRISENQDVVETLSKAIALGRLPIVEPSIFTGDPLTYPDWEFQFESLVEKRGVPNEERIHYLKKYLGGSARELVNGFFLLKSVNAYEEARKELRARYGDTFLVSESFRTKLDRWPKMSNKDRNMIRSFSDLLNQCAVAMLEIQGLKILDDIRELRKLSMKLPDYLLHQWNDKMTSIKGKMQRYPTFQEFSQFVRQKSESINDPIFTLDLQPPRSADQQPNRSYKAQNQRTTLATSGQHQVQQQEKFCISCKRKYHTLAECRQFAGRPKEEKLEFIRKERLCFGCLKPGHRSQACRERLTCTYCKGKHPSVLHEERKDSFDVGQTRCKENTEQKGSSKHTKANNGQNQDGHCLRTSTLTQQLTSMIVPVYVSTRDCPEIEVLAYALLDSMSDSTFVTDNCIEKLNACASPTSLRLTTMSNSNVDIRCRRVSDLMVRGYNSNKRIQLPTSYSRDSIPVDEDHIPQPSTVDAWPHLRSIQNYLVPKQDCPTALLIGYDCPAALAPINSIIGTSEQPFAVETELGWSVVGGAPARDLNVLGLSYRVLNLPTVTPAKDGSTKTTFTLRTQMKEVNPSEILQLMERDFVDSSPFMTQSQDDIKFLKLLTEKIRKRNDGFYEMPLPFRHENCILPNNRKAAFHRAILLKKRLSSNPKYKLHYLSFMQDIISQGEAERVPTEELNSKPCWYIPHHSVYHPKKPEKLRVVFDCSARCEGTCLNDNLLQGPDLLNPLVGVLCRFRQKPVAFTCDIKKMFHQFRVTPEHQDYLRFLWWEGGNLDLQATDYRMKVHLFGATSSPGCANFALKQIAKDYQDISPQAAAFLQRDFYVDDGLHSEETPSEARKILEEAKTICSQGNLKLHKFTSNSSEVLKDIPTEDLATSDDTTLGDKLERTLGLQWCTATDSFRFQLHLPNHPSTRRGILATVASVYDPLGLVAPLVLTGKQISQTLCQNNLKWDDPAPTSLLPQYENWKEELRKLTALEIPRCVRPASFRVPIKVQLHHFSDASQHAYGQCSYIRLENEDGEIHCSLLMAKARVAPLKSTTIPRLELQAAVLSTKVAKTLNQELEYDSITNHFWSDSKVVLGYIKNEKARFHIYVTNRIGQIRESTDPSQWNYVPTSINPADHASRGLTTADLKGSNWFSGPDFLWQKNVPVFTVSKDDLLVSKDDPEVKAEKLTHTLSTSTSKRFTNFEDRIKRFSSLKKATTAFAVLIQCCAKKRGKTLSRLESSDRAKKQLIKLAQQEAFADLDLSSKSNPLRNLTPFFDSESILRVGGRLSRSSEPFEVKHPAILPKDSHLSRLFASYFHVRSAHQGRNFTINDLRSNGIWITSCRSLVSSIIHKCVKCIKMRGKPCQQQMSDLPRERLEATPPFTHCGMDVFGPFVVKEGRKELKRYGLLFTCLALRAIHIEIIDDLTTDSFINGLRCFFAIRGKVTTIFCDNGSNFIGAKNELGGLDLDQFTKRFEALDCELRFNPPHASHMGGVWERQIRTVKSVLSGLLDSSVGRLDSTSLRTFMYEAMSIVNSRPLTYHTLERPDEPSPLAPNHLLTMKSDVVVPPPPGVFVREDLYLKKRWKRIQYMANQFWSRWKKEYLQNLQSRIKWQEKQPNAQVGDIVIIQEENARSEWRLARVVETFPGEDGLVRKAKLLLSTSELDAYGRQTRERTFLLRPIHKVIPLHIP